MASLSAEDRISRARTKLLLDRRYVFWATVGMYLNIVEKKEIPTMATDGQNIYYNADFVTSISDEELVFVVAHEAGHCALGHQFRRHVRDPFKWNIACDYALNQVLQDSGLRVPASDQLKALIDKKFEGMSAEEIYPKIKSINIKGWNLGAIEDDKSVGKDGNASGSAEAERKWEVVVRQAAANAKAQGHLPGAFEGLLKPITPKVDLHSMLRHLFSQTIREDYTWAKANKKHVYRGLYLPSEKTESVDDILVAVDVSGSVDDEMLSKFLGIVNAVMTDLRPRVVHLIQCDTEIHKHDEFRQGEMLPEKVGVRGRGGTDMRPIWEWVKENDVKISSAIVCSDFLMDQASFGKQQEFPVLWVTVDKNMIPPWGQVSRIEEE